MYNLNQIYSMILKSGISADRIKRKEMNQYGKIAAANSKEQMMANTGYTVGSIETLNSNAHAVTHFTPNVYHFLSRKGNVVRGHEEENLKQINTFVVDIDSPAVTVQDILLESLDIEVEPTLILRTDKGFHVYFILDKPVYVSRKTKYRSLRVAKEISKNIRLAYSEVLPGVDLTCNHFGYFRCPNKNNVAFYNPEATHVFSELMEWSKRKTDDAVTALKLVVDNTFKGRHRQVKEEWYRELMNQSAIYQGHGYGRNNTIFTLSLANYQSEVPEETCLDRMDEFNSRLEFPLSHRAVERIVKSAYSGKYQGAQKEYINALISSWTQKEGTTRAWNGFYKHKKAREDRKNSHAFEREQDIVEYIEKHQHRGVLEMSLRSLARVFNISITALKNALRQSKLIKVSVVGKGRYSKTRIYTVKGLLKHIRSLKGAVLLETLKEMNNCMSLLNQTEISTAEKKKIRSILDKSPVIQAFNERRTAGTLL